MKILLDGSGSSTKIRAVYTIFKYLIQERGIKPDVISGVSGTALLGVPIAMGKFKELDEALSDFNLDTFFSTKPVNEKGKLTFGALKNIACGNDYLGKMDNLKELFVKIITYDDYESYILSKKYPPVFVCSVDFKTGKKIITNLKTVKRYSVFVNLIISSASIPVFVEPIEISGKILYDGGVRNHSIGAKIMESEKITDAYCIFSRPEDYIIEEYDRGNLIKSLMRTIDIMSVEISKKDEEKQKLIAELRGVELTQIFIPSVLTSLYDVDSERLKKLDELALIEAKKKV